MTRINSRLLQVVEQGAFGNGKIFISFEKDNESVKMDQYQSAITFGTLKLSGGQSYEVVIKLNLGTKFEREFMKTDSQFHNEILMYKLIIPYLMSFYPQSSTQKSTIFPKFYYGIETDENKEEQSMIILENLRPHGYRLSEERVFLDFDHLAAGLQIIAKFHALSYVAKYKDKNSFLNSISGIKDTFWNSSGEWIFSEKIFTAIGKRGINRLIQRNPTKYSDHQNLKKLIGFIENNYDSIRRVLKPREPLAVLCHGDFCRNNILYRYNQNGCPSDALLIDVATSRYASPILDLSFFLYLNTDKKLRETRWNDLLDIYHSHLSQSVSNEVHIPSRSELNSEMSSYAFYGFVHVAFFLPCMVEKNPPTSTLDYLKQSPEERLKFHLTIGGDEGTEIVADVVQHIIDMGYIDLP